jgi:hypothetical protein
MSNAKPFYSFTDFGLKPFAATANIGSLLAKTQRIIDFEKQSGNGYIDYPFGTVSDGLGGFVSKFANDADFGQTGVNMLGAWIEKPQLNPNENKIVNFFKSIINFISVSETTVSIDAFAVANEPDAPYTFTNTDFAGAALEIYAVPNFPNKNRTFSLCISLQNSEIVVQWFISEIGDTGLASLYSEYGSKILPLSPDVDGFLYETKFYDFDFVLPPCNDLQSPLQIKSFDVLKFNVFPDQNNLEGVESAVIGIVDCEGNVVNENIGEAVLLDCVQTYETKIFYDFSTNQFFEWIGIVFGSSFQPSYLKIYGVDAALNKELLVQFSLDIAPGSDILMDTASNFCVQLEPLLTAYFGYNCQVTFTGGDTPTDRPEITIQIIANICNIVAIDFDFSYTFTTEESNFNVGLYTAINPKCDATQLQATATIPGNLPTGLYKLYLWDGYIGQVYAFSNSLTFDDYDNFSQILVYAGNGITQGFEYLSGWNQQARVPIRDGAPQPVIQDSEYRDGRGNFRSPSRKSDLSLDLHTSWITNEILEAIYAATQHSTFILAGKSLYIQGDIEVSHPQDFTTDSSYFGLTQVKFKAKIQNYQPLDNGCIDC